MNPSRFVNKRMLVVLNQMSINMAGGSSMSDSNIRESQNLGFVEKIHVNEIFGQAIYPDIYHQAAAYMFHVIKNHTFNDGNKRTGLLGAVAFLQWNGVVLAPFEEDSSYEFVMDVASGPNDPDSVIPTIAEWFRSVMVEQGT